MKRLLLLGGGHAHAFVLRALIGAPLADTRVTLVTPHEKHTYSGMLPGLVAGHYSVDEVQINVARLARAASAEVIASSVRRLDAARRSVQLENGSEIGYELASLNLGSLPNTALVPGSAEHALPVKPFERFLVGWDALLARSAARSPALALAGAGAAGVELAMAIRHRFASMGREARVVLYSDRPMFAPALAQRIARALARHGVELRMDRAVEAVEAGPVVVAHGKREAYDALVWTAGAAPLPWLADTGLATDRAGFVLVDETLRSTSHPEVFAAGDCASLREARHPKSGVFAVRHGAVLARNLRGALSGGRLERYAPQKRALALISCGSRSAIADWGGWAAEGAWVWRWKDRLDRRWVEGFRRATG